MEWQQLLIDTFELILQGLEQVLANISQVDLDEQPHLDSNSMGWLTWHLTRTQDRAIVDLPGEKQIWIENGWYARFNRAPDPSDTGLGHKSEDVAMFKSPGVITLPEYHREIVERSKRCLNSLSTSELGRKLDHPRFPMVGARLVAVLSDNFQLSGLIPNKAQAIYNSGIPSRFS